MGLSSSAGPTFVTATLSSARTTGGEANSGAAEAEALAVIFAFVDPEQPSPQPTPSIRTPDRSDQPKSRERFTCSTLADVAAPRKPPEQEASSPQNATRLRAKKTAALVLSVALVWAGLATGEGLFLAPGDLAPKARAELVQAVVIGRRAGQGKVGTSAIHVDESRPSSGRVGERIYRSLTEGATALERHDRVADRASLARVVSDEQRRQVPSGKQRLQHSKKLGFPLPID